MENTNFLYSKYIDNTIFITLTERRLSSWSRHLHLKRGRMIVLQNSNLPLSIDFFIEKKTPSFQNAGFSLHQIRRYPAPYISKAGQKATPSNILQPFIPHCFPLQSPYINSRPFISSPHYFYSSPIRFRICPTPAQPTSILTRIVFPADQQPILNDQFYVEEMPEEIVIVVKLIYSDRTHST